MFLYSHVYPYGAFPWEYSRVGGCYLLHFTDAYKHARHYLGWSTDIARRVYRHRAGRSGVGLTEAAAAAGIEMRISRIWRGGDRRLERALRNRHDNPSLCPICHGPLSRDIPF